jgi:hypothetical protein
MYTSDVMIEINNLRRDELVRERELDALAQQLPARPSRLRLALAHRLYRLAARLAGADGEAQPAQARPSAAASAHVG